MTISVIKTDGSEDYSTIQAWEDDCPSDITAGGTNENWEGELFNEEFLNAEGNTTFGGITTDATHKLIIRPVSGGGFADNADPSSDALRYDASLGAALRSTINYVRIFDFGTSATVRCDIIGIQFKSEPTISKCLLSQGTQPTRSFGCIFDSDASTGAVGQEVVFVRNTSGDRHEFENCVIIGISNPSLVRQSDSIFNFCTFYGGSDVTNAQYTLGDFTSCLFLRSTGFQPDAAVNAIDFCVTDLASWESSSASDSVLNATASDEIEADTNVASTVDLRAKAGGDSDGGGTPISGITTDIYGQTRDASTPTVGAFEIVAAAGGVTVELTGQLSTTSQGALTVTGAANTAITGQVSTSAQGTITATGASTVTLTGQLITSGQGAVTVVAGAATVVSITGQEITALQGALTVAIAAQITLTGQEITSQQGALTVVVGAGAVVALTGQSAAAQQGSLSLSTANIISLSGQAIIPGQGVISISTGSTWTNQADAVTNWGDQADSTTNWADQTDASTIWTKQ